MDESIGIIYNNPVNFVKFLHFWEITPNKNKINILEISIIILFKDIEHKYLSWNVVIRD